MRENPHCYTLSPITAPVSPPSTRHAEALSRACICISTRRFVHRQERSIMEGTDGGSCCGADQTFNLARGAVRGNTAASSRRWKAALRHLQLYAAAAFNGLDPNICSGLVPYVCP